MKMSGSMPDDRVVNEAIRLALEKAKLNQHIKDRESEKAVAAAMERAEAEKAKKAKESNDNSNNDD